MAEHVTAIPDRRDLVPGSPPDQPAHEPPAPGALPDSVAGVLRRLHDAAAAHDED
jgi:hypothetical protein